MFHFFIKQQGVILATVGLFYALLFYHSLAFSVVPGWHTPILSSWVVVVIFAWVVLFILAVSLTVLNNKNRKITNLAFCGTLILALPMPLLNIIESFSPGLLGNENYLYEFATILVYIADIVLVISILFFMKREKETNKE
ncbi:MAG: hypothetical protein H6607_04730 [Flavobacteriales bacterium]|nr:hypothetical protein [Flavobacteriales bacterium]